MTNADYVGTHRALWIELRDRVAASLKDKADAQYAANALMERDDGRDLLRRIVAHLDNDA